MQYTLNMQDDSSLLTTQETASYLRVHVETVRNWARRGILPSIKLSNRGGFRFRREDLDQFLRSREVGLPRP
jgi:excisionase family DNA binding protein